MSSFPSSDCAPHIVNQKLAGGLRRFTFSSRQSIKKRTETLYQSFSPFLKAVTYFDAKCTPYRPFV